MSTHTIGNLEQGAPAGLRPVNGLVPISPAGDAAPA